LETLQKSPFCKGGFRGISEELAVRQGEGTLVKFGHSVSMFVIPAQAGIQEKECIWIPDLGFASSGMTIVASCRVFREPIND